MQVVTSRTSGLACNAAGVGLCEVVAGQSFLENDACSASRSGKNSGIVRFLALAGSTDRSGRFGWQRGISKVRPLAGSSRVSGDWLK